MAVAVMRQDVSVGDLRREAGQTRDAKAARRMLAIALVMDRQSREVAAGCCGMDRQTLRDWGHRQLGGWLACEMKLSQVAGQDDNARRSQLRRLSLSG